MDETLYHFFSKEKQWVKILLASNSQCERTMALRLLICLSFSLSAYSRDSRRSLTATWWIELQSKSRPQLYTSEDVWRWIALFSWTASLGRQTSPPKHSPNSLSSVSKPNWWTMVSCPFLVPLQVGLNALKGGNMRIGSVPCKSQTEPLPFGKPGSSSKRSLRFWSEAPTLVKPSARQSFFGLPNSAGPLLQGRHAVPWSLSTYHIPFPVFPQKRSRHSPEDALTYPEHAPGQWPGWLEPVPTPMMMPIASTNINTTYSAGFASNNSYSTLGITPGILPASRRAVPFPRDLDHHTLAQSTVSSKQISGEKTPMSLLLWPSHPFAPIAPGLGYRPLIGMSAFVTPPAGVASQPLSSPLS